MLHLSFGENPVAVHAARPENQHRVCCWQLTHAIQIVKPCAAERFAVCPATPGRMEAMYLPAAPLLEEKLRSPCDFVAEQLGSPAKREVYEAPMAVGSANRSNKKMFAKCLKKCLIRVGK